MVKTHSNIAIEAAHLISLIEWKNVILAFAVP